MDYQQKVGVPLCGHQSNITLKSSDVYIFFVCFWTSRAFHRILVSYQRHKRSACERKQSPELPSLPPLLWKSPLTGSLGLSAQEKQSTNHPAASASVQKGFQPRLLSQYLHFIEETFETLLSHLHHTFLKYWKGGKIMFGVKFSESAVEYNIRNNDKERQI